MDTNNILELDAEDSGLEADGKLSSKNIKNFEKWLKRNNYSSATIMAYIKTISDYQKRHKTLSKTSLLVYRQYLIDHYAPSSVNQKVYALNKFLEYSHRKLLTLKGVKIQNKPFLENVITHNDYRYFCKRLLGEKTREARKVYFLVKYIACTGARPSELVRFCVDHVELGWMDIYSKGGKIRRIYIPQRLKNTTLRWLKDEKIESGTIFRNKNGQTITTRGVNKLLKIYAQKYKSIPLESVYAYSFRHRYAINFIEKKGDLMLLADLMGHSSLEVTRRYTRMSSAEQYKTVSEIVTW